MQVLVLLCVLGAWAKDDSLHKDSNYVIKQIASCPEVGYFFKRESIPNALDSQCYLCFCQDNGTAVCWQRSNSRCDVRHYQHGIAKRETRVRRSPLGLSDIFFRDAARDLFNKQVPKTCKPYETTFSEGCPPADWCTGCTVCDCDANGQWDCHVLSFCPDKKDKNKTKKSKKPLRQGSPKRTTSNPKRTTSNSKRSTSNPKKTTKPIAKTTKRTITKKPLIKNNSKQIKNTRKMKPDNKIQKRSNSSPKPLIIKKDSILKNPVLLKTENSQLLLTPNDTARITQEVYKKVVAAVHQMITKNIASNIVPAIKTVQKRSLEKKKPKHVSNEKNAKKNVNGQFKSAGPSNKQYRKVVPPKKKPMIPNKKVVKKAVPSKQSKAKRNIPKAPVKAVKKGKTTTKPTQTSNRNWRMKREISYSYNNTEPTVNITVSEEPVTTKYQPNTSESEIVNNGTTKDNYYRYSVFTVSTNIDKQEYQIVYAINKNDSNPENITHAQNKRAKSKDDLETTTVEQHTLRIEKKHISKVNDVKLSVQTAVPDFNDLKFQKWYQLKMLKYGYLNNTLLANNTVRTNTTEVSKHGNDTTTFTNKHARDIGKTISPIVRKYNKSKIVNHIDRETKRSQKFDFENTFKGRIYHKIDDLQNVLKKLLNKLRQNNSTKVKPKPKRFNVVKYLKKFFSTVFKKRKGRGKLSTKQQEELDSHILDTICENLSDCDVKHKNDAILKKKVRELNNESHIIMRTIKIIKGLLRLFEFPEKTSKDKILNRREKSCLKKDILKLNAILKDRYTTNDHEMTETQITQINYIKNNTQFFIHSVGRFANKLNEIISILTKKASETSNKNQRFTRRSFFGSRKTKDASSVDSLKNLKNLLAKYSLVQNSFIHKMNETLSKFEKTYINKTSTLVKNKNTSSAIEHFSKNIITNLRKLKRLAETLNSGTRRKRDLFRDDDAMDYILTLMEYLLKQNHPLDAAPVNDGIDLLIDAIKNAPDVKPIKKKVLQSIPANIRVSRTTEPPPRNISKIDSSLNINKISQENNYKSDTRSETAEQSGDQDGNDDKVVFEDSNTETVYYKKIPVTSDTKTFETTVVPGAYSFKGHADDTTEYNHFERLEINAKEDAKKFEVFNADLEDTDVDSETTSTTVATDVDSETESVPVTVIVPMETTEFRLPDLKERQTNYLGVSGNSGNEQRVTLDWLDEGYEQDSKEIRQVYKETVTTQIPTTSELTTRKKPLQINNISSLTKEDIEEEGRKRKSKLNVEDIMFKKQMDLLNSLDYGTERSDDDSDRDGDDRYSEDSFSSYFV